ncbi:hypothetical protein CXB49_03575 [Chromobacterium sp. ATCC 53434]|uniref:hypothetical protein n=1 Tax=Chromobacterium TaxID=535 RepID=UPI000C7845F5|nr:hypothetical protein [Chromobacterium sp. ATCC 53434]AUH49976.1 hypothetical protein CXB49_03575 [Chromobacterium sp. ATCC 53434]
MGKSIDDVVAKLGDARRLSDGAPGMPRRMAAALPGDLALELMALAAAFHDSSEALAGELLGAAIADAWDALDDGQLLQATRACRRLLDDGEAGEGLPPLH